jgi:hypothetical protein
MCLTSCQNHQEKILGEWLLEDMSIEPSSNFNNDEKTSIAKDFESNKPTLISLSSFNFYADSTYAFNIAGNVSEGKYHFIHSGKQLVVNVTNNSEYALQKDTFDITLRDDKHLNLSQLAPFGKLNLYLRKK